MSEFCLICWLLTAALISYCPFRSRETSTFTSSGIHHLANVFYLIYLRKRDWSQHFFFLRPWLDSRKSSLCSLRWSAFKFPKQTKATKSQALQTRDTCAKLEKEKTKQCGADSVCDTHDSADVAPSVWPRQILCNFWADYNKENLTSEYNIKLWQTFLQTDEHKQMKGECGPLRHSQRDIPD